MGRIREEDIERLVRSVAQSVRQVISSIRSGTEVVLPAGSVSTRRVRQGTRAAGNLDVSVLESPAPTSTWTSLHRNRVAFLVSGLAEATSQGHLVIPVDFTQFSTEAGAKEGELEQNSLRVVGSNPPDRKQEEDLPFQFDKAHDFNRVGNAAGELIVDVSRLVWDPLLLHVYFDEGEIDDPRPEVIPKVTTNYFDADDPPRVEIRTPAAKWIYDLEGGGIAGIIDSEGCDWVSHNASAGSAGEYRGIPNAVHPDGHFHPGFSNVRSSLASTGPLRCRIVSTTTDGTWSTMWDVFPDRAEMTMLKASRRYWFLYEGTPAGAMLPETQYLLLPDGRERPLSEPWFGRMPQKRWAAFVSPEDEESLLVADHGRHNGLDCYFNMNNEMTVFGFGRGHKSRGLLKGSPRRFSVGLVGTTAFGDLAAWADAALSTPTVKRYRASRGPA